MLADLSANSDFSSARISYGESDHRGRIYDRIIDAVWYVEFDHFLCESIVSIRIERFTEVERDDATTCGFVWSNSQVVRTM